MTDAEERIRVIEKVIETDDAFLLHKVASLLHTSTLADCAPQTMSHEAFIAKIGRAETAYQNGEVTDHEDVTRTVFNRISLK